MTENNVVEFDTAEQKKWLEKKGIESEQWAILCKNLYPGEEPAHVKMVWDYCKVNNLDPLKKPVHLVPMQVKTGIDRYGNDIKTKRVQVMMGIGAWRIQAHRTGKYAGKDEAIYGDDIEVLGVEVPEWCAITVYRIVDGIRCAFVGQKVYFAEVCGKKGIWEGPTGKKKKVGEEINSMWKNRPVGQLTKCAEAEALREAFPEQFSGEYLPEEMYDRVIEGEGEAWKPVYTEEQFIYLCELINNSDGLELVAFLKSLNEKEHGDIMGAYYKKAPHGQKGEYAKTVKEIYEKGEEKLENLVMDMSSMLDSADDLGINQIIEENSKYLNDLLIKRVEGLGEFLESMERLIEVEK